MIVHTTKSEAARKTSMLMLFAFLLLAPGAALLTLHMYCRPSGGRASRLLLSSHQGRQTRRAAEGPRPLGY